MLQNRNWTADRLRNRGWPHDDVCCLCSQQLETACHLALHCPFVLQVTDLFFGSHPRMILLLRQSSSIEEWWRLARRHMGSSQQQREWKKEVSLAVYIFWHVWKERGRRIFQQEILPAEAVVSLIKSDVELLFIAKGR